MRWIILHFCVNQLPNENCKNKKSLLIIIKNDGNFMLTLENGRLGASFLFNVPNVVVPPTLLLRHCPSYRPRAKL